MPEYVKTNWVEGVTPLGPVNLNKIENGIAAAIRRGDVNTDVELVKSLLQPVDTRSISYSYTGGNISTVTIKDGATTVKTIAITYKANGDVDYVTEVVGATTITTTYAYNADGTISSETRVVV